MNSCPNLSNKKIKAEFDELVSVFGENMAYYLWDKSNGNGLELAPNGASSKLFQDLLKLSNGDRRKALIEKAKVYSDEFINWFGDWLAEDKIDVSKVVDENGEPLIVYHGGAKDISIFHSGGTNTGNGTYTDPKTGQKIPVDSDRTMFFSDNKYVGESYAALYSIQKFDFLRYKVDSLIRTTYDQNKPGFSKEVFKTIQGLYDTLQELAKFNPRFEKFLNYLKSTVSKGERIKPNEAKAFREMLIDVRGKIRPFTEHWLMNMSEWNFVHDQSIQFYNTYNNDEGIKRLQNGEIPSFLEKEWQIFKKIQGHRKKQQLSQIANYEEVYHNIGCGRYLYYSGGDLIYYDGSSMREKKKVKDMSYDEIKDMLEGSYSATKHDMKMHNDDTYISLMNESSQYAVYLNVRNPLSHDYEGTHQGQGYKESKEHSFGYVAARQVNKAINDGNDGVIYQNLYDPYLANNYGVFNPNQIKSAINNKGGFDSEDPNIYHNLTLLNPVNECKQLLRNAQLIRRSGNGWIANLNNNNHNIDLTMSQIKGVCKRYNVTLDEDKQGYLYFIEYLSRDDEIKHNENKNVDGEKIMAFLQERFPQLRVVVHTKKEDLWEIAGTKTNAFVQRGVVHLYEGSLKSSANVVAEEFLHPFITAIQNQNPILFNELLKEAKSTFPKLYNQIVATYTKNKGFDQSDIDNEIVAHALARHFVKENKGGEGKKFREIANQFLEWVAYHINKFIDSIGYRKVVDAKDLPNMTLGQLAKLINSNDLTFNVDVNDDKKRHNLSEEDISKAITDSFATLYESYRRMPGRSTRRESIKNKVYETMTKLRTIHTFNAVNIALDFALESLGVFDESTGNISGYDSSNPSTYNKNIWTLLQSEKDRYSSPSQYFSKLNADELVNLYKNNIGFYKNLLDQIQYLKTDSGLRQIDQTLALNIAKKIQALETSLQSIENLWKEALVKVTDRIVDKYVDEQGPSDEADRQAMKINYKDALHENILFGDINTWQSWIQNAGMSDSPIVKLGFHIIQEANLKTQTESHHKAVELTKAYQKVPKAIRKLGAAWQTVFMEFDRSGIPTGKFARPINYGQYEQDLNNFVKELNDRFDEEYGYHYVKDGDSFVNSVTGARSDEEEWGSTGDDNDDMPTFVKYQLEIEKWKCDHCNRRYTYNYYKERLSRPYKYQDDPQTLFDDEAPHGLSPKTLARYDYYQSNINYYLSKCVDKDTGYARPEKLSKKDRDKLKLWQDELEQFANPFDQTGNLKTGDDFQMAMEVQRWQQFIGEKLSTTVSLEKYRIEYSRAEHESVSKGDPSILDDFVKCNTHYGINPNYIAQTIGRFRNKSQHYAGAIQAEILKRALTQLTKQKGSRTLDKNLDQFLNQPWFWVLCKEYDQMIEDYKDKDPSFGLAFANAFKSIPQFYVDQYGNYRDLLGRTVTPADIEAAENAGKPRTDLLKYHDFVIQYYINKAKSEGRIDGFNDKNGRPYDFSLMTDKEILDAITLQFSYSKLVQDPNTGVYETRHYPLTIFSITLPSAEQFQNARTGGMEPTILDVPQNRFATKEDKEKNDPALMYLNADYDLTQQESEQPMEDLYKNEDFDKIHNMGPEVENLYNLLVQTVREQKQLYDPDEKLFNYDLPQINAENFAILSRAFKGGGVKINAGEAIDKIWQSITGVQENDSEMRSQNEWITNPDGTRTLDVPRRFYRPLDDPSTITTDITGAVKLFVRSTNNYNNSKKVQGMLESMMYAMQDQNRDLSPGSQVRPGASKNQLEAFKQMMETNLYDNKFDVGDESSKLSVAGYKSIRFLQRFASLQLLAFNFLSIRAGFRDQIKTILSDALVGKYIRPEDFAYGILHCYARLPWIIKNIGDPLANNKVTALMQLMGVSKDYRRTHEGTNRSALRKASSQILMGGFSALDYFGSSILLVAVLNNSKLFNGLTDSAGNVIIPKGFYNETELIDAFIRAGYVPADARKEASRARKFFATSLYDAFEYKDGDVFLKSEYADYATLSTIQHAYGTVFQRAALAAGTTPENDVPKWKTKIATGWIGAMRGWMHNWYQQYMNGRAENVVPNLQQEDKETVRHGVTRNSKKMIKKGKIASDYARSYSWSFDTGRPMDRIIPSLCDAFMAKLKSIKNVFIRGRHVEKMSPTQRYALKTVVANTALVAALGFYTNCWIESLQNAPVPPSYTTNSNVARREGYTDSYEEARQQSSMWYPWEKGYYDYEIWKWQEADISYRAFESSVGILDPTIAFEMIKSITTLSNGLDEIVGAPVGMGQYFLGMGDDEVIKQASSYKNYKKGEVKGLWKSFGPMDNLHTYQSYWGLRSNLQFYVNKTHAGKIMEFFGGTTTLTPKKSEKLKKNAIIQDSDIPDMDTNLPDMDAGIPDF